MDEPGIVISATDGSATVRMTQSGACDSCGQASLCHPGGGTERTLVAHDPVGVRAGQEVMVRIPGRGVWVALLLVYGWPLLMLVAGAVLGYRLGLPGGEERADLLAAVGALLFLGLGFVTLRALRHLYERHTALHPVIVTAANAGAELPISIKNSR